MTAADFRRIALSLERVEDYSHARWPAFGCDPSAVTMWLRVRLTSAEFAAHSKRRATRRTRETLLPELLHLALDLLVDRLDLVDGKFPLRDLCL